LDSRFLGAAVFFATADEDLSLEDVPVTEMTQQYDGKL